ncbi:transporter substrate-binding domain-containing protein [Legionella brunensis]|uniref:Putative amino acid ABC transporter, periplasmic binding protein n=1 Tax=Legionella brunensis TaxID=29422 RepID=A0A0W0SSE8_9GAMM|nr:transporter substrate-binding domain-containing protein [Legionella brunensis]KTC86296.1 putative amino acid ABC transporter, periplasmic binding protein [Legionella brunensis]
MKRLLSFVLYLSALLSWPLHAQNEPLRVGVDTFTPPFIMEGANSQLFGFDISMMKYICNSIHRSCVFVPTDFDKIFDSLEARQIDVAVSAITITPERATRVNFSIPYLLSHSRFIGPSKLAKEHFSLQLLNDHTIGVEQGTIFPAVINAMGVRNPTIETFKDAPTLIDALQNGDVDIALMDDPSAMYWQSQSSGLLSVLGEPFSTGFGLGIAINRNEVDLLTTINQAIVQYQDSANFKQDFDKYIAHF